ncbi:MAG TPA: recombinase family protein, partial [Anaerolineales bacterium]|nr:recombinase family protein [Anaerolineales bacterium]
LRDMTQWAARTGLRSAKGNVLDRLSIRKLLTNPSYAGKVSFHARSGKGVVLEGNHPAIVEPDLFDQVQSALAKRRFRRPDRPYGKEPYPLSVTGICGSCGAALSGCASVKEGRYRYRYYRCSTAHRRGRAACKQPMVQANVFEDQIAAYVGGMRLPPEYLGAIMEELRLRHRSVSVDSSRVEQARQTLDRWRRLFALGEIDEETLVREAAPLKASLAEVDEPREALDVEEAMGYLRRVGELWAESPRAQQRAFVREVFERVVVKDREVTSITPREVYAPLFVLDRRERFGDDGSNSCNVAPRAGLEPTT